MFKGTNRLGGYCLFLAVFVSMLAGPDAAADTTTTVACSTSKSGVIDHLPTSRPFLDALGLSSTFTAAGALSSQNPFFENLGANGRTCGSCHKVDQGWTISPPAIQFLFDLTRGTDPIFNTVDGSNSPVADVSTFQTRRSAYSMLLNRGTIRVGIGIPAGADFELTAVDDPYGFASAAQLSLFRRPLPATNLKFIPAVMWAGRVTGDSLPAALANEAAAATQGHAQRPTPLDEATADQIVAFETGLYTAQALDFKVGRLDINGGLGGAENLANQAIVAARWDLFDAFQNNANPKYQAIYR